MRLIYAIDRSKAVVLVRFLVCVALCVFTTRRFMSSLTSLPVLMLFFSPGASFINGRTTYFRRKYFVFPLLYIRFTKFVRRKRFDETGP